MNGMAANSWPYVIAAYSVTWVVIVGYTIRLVLMARRNSASRTHSVSNS
ncbi:MAG: CcmD family protein [Gemmatimonadaceae bacterium]|nr:CcmD family protein [Gemmatimonadaceae bacterium]